MARQLELNVAIRELTTKGALNQIKQNGDIPCVIYGKGVDTIHASVNKKSFLSLAMHSLDEHVIFDLKVEGKKKVYHAIIKDRNLDPIKQEITHIDFFVIDMKKPLKLYSEFVFEGTSKGVKKGGILEVRMTKIKGEAIPLDYPKYIKHNISNLDIGDVLKIKDLDLPKGLTLFADGEESILAVALPKSMRGGGAQETQGQAETDSEPGAAS